MHIPNVIFKFTNYRNGRIYRLRYSVYTVIKEIKPGEKSLVVVNHGGEYIYPTEDIVR